jgi:metallophosphoesterase (TIGR00282 family)
MRIMFIGDIVGRTGRKVISDILAKCIREHNIGFVVANGENAAGGLGITPAVFEELTGLGVDVITSGNHIWKRREVFEILDESRLLRPLNYPEGVPGTGFGIYERDGVRIAVVNIQGRVFMEALDCPFDSIDKALELIADKSDIILVDFHAEATSEKLAMSWYLDGKVSAVLGTHTHVQTSDARILSGGTACVTDAGMTGSVNGVIGVEKEEIIKHFLTGLPFSYRSCAGNGVLEGVIMEFDNSTGKSVYVETIRMKA